MEIRFGLIIASILGVVVTANAETTKLSRQDAQKVLQEASKELGGYMEELHRDFHEILMGDDFHQAYDFRVIIQPKSIQCYYQEANVDTVISLNFENVDSSKYSSAKSMVVAAIKIGHTGVKEIISSVNYENKGELEIEVTEEGTYGFCFDNSGNSGFTTTQIVIDVWRNGEIQTFHESQMGRNMTLYNFMGNLYRVTRDLATMRVSISHSRSTLYHDYLIRKSNLSRINNFSIASVFLICGVCFFQLHVVKKMFANQKTVV